MEDLIYRICIAAPGFILAISFHEWAHAFCAYKMGDPTAKSMGRLTLNPSAHYDLIGTIIMPLFFAAVGLGIFGYAKPVPVDPRRLKNFRSGIFWVSFAGPLANIFLGVFSSFLLAFMYSSVDQSFYLFEPFTKMLVSSVQINVILAVFNLIPFPPLDGSKMVSTFLSFENMMKFESLARFNLLFFILLWQTNALTYLIMPVLGVAQNLINVFYGMMV